MFKRGDRVIYHPYRGCSPESCEYGIVKRMCDDGEHAFVLYDTKAMHYTEGDLDNYTAARTSLSQLTRRHRPMTWRDTVMTQTELYDKLDELQSKLGSVETERDQARYGEQDMEKQRDDALLRLDEALELANGICDQAADRISELSAERDELASRLDDYKKRIEAISIGAERWEAAAKEASSRLGECQDALQTAQVDRHGADEYTRDLEAKLDKYEKWFSDNAANLAVHNIGGFSMSPLEPPK